MTSSESRPSGVGYISRWAVLGVLALAVAAGAYAALRGRLTTSPAPIASDRGVSTVSDSTLQESVIPVEGMSCGACAARIKGALKDIGGVQNVEVSLIERSVRVRHATEKVTPDQLASAINALGYKAGVPAAVESGLTDSGMKRPQLAGSDPQVKGVSIAVEGMACEGCAQTLQETLSEIDGVKNVRIGFKEKEAQIQFVDGKVTPERLLEVIELRGFKAKRLNTESGK